MAKKEKSSLLLPYEFEDVFDYLSAEDAGILIKAIFDYERRGIEPDFSAHPILLAMWSTHIKAKIDKNKKAYNDVVEARTEAGKKGGRPKNSENQMKAKKPNGFLQNQTKAKKPDCDCDCDCDCDWEGEKQAANAREANQTSTEVNEAIKFYAARIAPVSGSDISAFRVLVITYGIDAFKAAVMIMQQRGGRSLRYLEKILKDPQTMGTARQDEDVGLSEEVISRVLS